MPCTVTLIGNSDAYRCYMKLNITQLSPLFGTYVLCKIDFVVHSIPSRLVWAKVYGAYCSAQTAYKSVQSRQQEFKCLTVQIYISTKYAVYEWNPRRR